MIQFKNVNYSYAEKGEVTLKDLSFTINRGEFILLTGKSGSGKSSVLQAINGIIPQYYKGDLSGEILIDNESIIGKSVQELSRCVGTVFQNPKSQFFHLNAQDELTFGPSNQALPIDEIKRREKVTVKEFKIENILHKNVLTLSGGEMQRLACASVHMSLPQIYVLDEPSANLDSDGIEELKDALKAIKNRGATIIIAEHRIYYALELCDKVLHMEDGKLAKVYTREDFLKLDKIKFQSMGMRSVVAPSIERQSVDISGKGCVNVEKLLCKRKKETLLDIENLSIPKHCIIAITGVNGAGKSTFVKTFAGIMKSDAVITDEKLLSKKDRIKRSFIVMQDVNSQLSCESVYDELVEKDTPENEKRALEILKSLNLSDKKDEHPFSLSGGQKQRVAIATALFLNKQYMFFDEPTSGLDFESMSRVSELIEEVSKTAEIVCVITHDKEFINKCCDYEINFCKSKIHAVYKIVKEKSNE